jgi:hypothetical protein
MKHAQARGTIGGGSMQQARRHDPEGVGWRTNPLAEQVAVQGPRSAWSMF